MNDNNALIQVAKIGRLVGLNGELKLNIHCDFPEQFHQNAIFPTDKNFKLEINTFNKKRNTVSFKGYNNRDDAAVLVNVNLFSTKENSMKECALEEGEYFWFDMIGAILKDEVTTLGQVSDIERMGASDYLVIETVEDLVEKNLSKLFYVPYIDRYIVKFDIDEKVIYSKDTLGILENS